MISLVKLAVGICASDRSHDLAELVRLVISERYPENVSLEKVVIVASACPKETIENIADIANQDKRVKLIVEEKRYGKAEAINKILARCKEDILVLVNSDAYPKPSTLSNIVGELLEDEKTGVVSALPTFNSKESLMTKINQLIWKTHNVSCFLLNHEGLLNHACDETLAIKRCILESMPEDTINDGSYIGSSAWLKGYKVKFSISSVRIEVPKSIASLFAQRRRIIYGHIQVWRKVGMPPRNLESLTFTKPSLALKIFATTLRQNPSYIVFIPLVVAEEFIAALAAIIDTFRNKEIHRIWKRYTQ